MRLRGSIKQSWSEFDPAIRRLGVSLARQGKLEEGLRVLEHAVAKNRSRENLISLAQTLAYPSEGKQGTTDQKRLALSLIVEASQKTSNDNDPSYPES
jgi:hypothetical protein